MVIDNPDYRAFLGEAFSRFENEGELIRPLRTLIPFGTYKPSLPVLTRTVEKLPMASSDRQLIAEFGVYKGRSINHLAKLLPNADIYGFDSFRGFPDDGRSDWAIDFNVARLPKVAANVSLVEGMFADTLATFDDTLSTDTIFDLAHIDCDIYSSTKMIFDTLGHRFVPGTIIVFDELVNYAEYAENEFLAFFEFLSRRNLAFRWLVKVGRLYGLDDDAGREAAGGFRTHRRRRCYQNVAVVLT